MVDMNKLVGEIENYHKNGAGLAWDMFWEHWDGAERVGSKNIKFAARRLNIYLFNFRTGENTGLLDCDIASFETFFKNIKEPVALLYNYKFGRLKASDEKKWKELYELIKDELDKIEVTSTDAMITTIMMATTGTVPAFDTKFNEWFSENIEIEEGSSIFQKLLALQDQVNDMKIYMNLDKEYRFTRFERKREIPLARLIDMGAKSRTD